MEGASGKKGSSLESAMNCAFERETRVSPDIREMLT